MSSIRDSANFFLDAKQQNNICFKATKLHQRHGILLNNLKKIYIFEKCLNIIYSLDLVFPNSLYFHPCLILCDINACLCVCVCVCECLSVWVCVCHIASCHQLIYPLLQDSILLPNSFLFLQAL